jgi:hypothetical protein
LLAHLTTAHCVFSQSDDASEVKNTDYRALGLPGSET